MKEWIVRTDSDASAYTMLPTTLRSMSMTRSMMSRTNSFLKNITNNSKSALRASKKLDSITPQTVAKRRDSHQMLD